MVYLNEIKGAIFDVDGTLLDSMPMWGHIETDYLISRGIMPRPGMSDDLRTLGGLEVPMYFQSEYDLRETVTEIQAGINKLAEYAYLNKLQLKDGVIASLKELRACGVKMCVATATDKCLVEPALQRCGVLGYFERIFSCVQEETSKNTPDIFIRAAAFLGTDICDTLVVEDALYAMKTAKSAGFPIAAVYDRSFDNQQDEIRACCDLYYYSLAEFRDAIIKNV